MGCLLSCFRIPNDEDLYGDCPDQRGFHDRRLQSNDLLIKRTGVSSSRRLQAETALDHEDLHEHENPSEVHSNTVTEASECSSSLTEEDDECPICLEVFEDENPKITLLCNHQFHLGCVYAWMERSAACPLCARMMLFEEHFL